MSQAPLGWAIAGTGAIARRFSADMRFSRDGRIVAVASATSERARALAAMIGPTVAHGDLDAILRRPDVGAIYVAGRNEDHCTQALRCLAAGKPVLIEKPLTTSAADARRIVDAARDAGLLAMEAMWMRFTPGMRRFETIVRSGRIGRVRTLEASLSFANDRTGVGPLLDLGVYPVSLAVWLLGRPNVVAAAASADGRQATLALGYDDAVASLACGFAAEGLNRVGVSGTRGRLLANAPLFAPSLLRVQRTSEPTTAPSVDERAQLAPAARPAWRPALVGLLRSFRGEPSAVFMRGSGLHYQADHFAECLQRGLSDSPVMPLAQSIDVLRIVEAAEAAIRDQSSKGSGAKVDAGL